MADDDLIKLYSKRILALAASLEPTERLADPAGTARRRSPLCGSAVAVDLDLDAAGRVSAFAQDVKACALGQAAASAVGSAIMGRTRDEVEKARDELVGMLKREGPAPNAPFDALAALLPAKDYKNRHASIMLSLEATIDAFEDAKSKATA